jgi:hypothetical protein
MHAKQQRMLCQQQHTRQQTTQEAWRLTERHTNKWHQHRGLSVGFVRSTPKGCASDYCNIHTSSSPEIHHTHSTTHNHTTPHHSPSQQSRAAHNLPCICRPTPHYTLAPHPCHPRGLHTHSACHPTTCPSPNTTHPPNHPTHLDWLPVNRVGDGVWVAHADTRHCPLAPINLQRLLHNRAALQPHTQQSKATHTNMPGVAGQLRPNPIQ